MAIFLILWIVGMVGVTLKFVKGHAGFSLIGREIWYLVLCIVLFAAAVSTDAVTKISTLSLKFHHSRLIQKYESYVFNLHCSF